MARTYEEMKRIQREIGPAGPSGPIREAVPVAPEDDLPIEADYAGGPDPRDYVDDQNAEVVPTAVPVEPVTPAKPAVPVNAAKRAVVLNALRNSPEGIKQFAQRVRRAYKISRDFKATDQEILQAAFDLQRNTIPDLTPKEYEKAIYDLYGKDVDASLLKQGHVDYPGFNDETSLIDEMYKRKVAKAELAPLSVEDKALIVARRFPALHKSDMKPEAALRLKYDELKKKGKNVGSFDDWLHSMMAPTLLEHVGGFVGAIGSGVKEQVKQIATLQHELSTPGQLSADIALAAKAGDTEAGQAAKERLKDAGKGAVTVGSVAATPIAGAGIKAAETALGAAKTAPALVGAAEGIAAGAVQGGGQAAIEGKSPAEVAQEAATAAGLAGLVGAGAGAWGGHVQKVRSAAAEAEAAAADAAAKAVGSADLPPAPAPIPAAAPVTDALELAAQERAEQGYAAMMREFSEKHGMDLEDVVKLAGREELSIQDIAAANARNGVTMREIEELRTAMPEHLKPSSAPTGPAAPAEGPVPAGPQFGPRGEVLREAEPGFTPPEPVAPAAPAAPVVERGVLQSEVSERMTHALNQAQGQLAKRRSMIREQLSARLAAARNAYGSAGGGLAGLRAKLRMMAGEMKKPEWAGVADEFKDVDIGAMHDVIARAPLLEGDKLTAHAGLERLWNGTRMGAPTSSQLRVLRMAFGSEFVEAASKNRTLWQKVGAQGLRLLNTPRTIMTSFDLSAGMRQGYLMVSRPEYWRAWKTMVKSFGSQRVADDVIESIKVNPKYDVMQESGLFFQGDAFGMRSETFAGSFADRWAGIKHSQRAYDTFINKLRADVFSSVYDDLAAAGVEVTNPQFRQSLAHWVNTGTGRGSMALLGRDASTLNAVAFSPRLAWSRFETFNPMYYKGLAPEVRKAAMKANMKAVGASMTLLGLMAGSSQAKVEWDPRNSDFAKLRFGNTRIDVLGGHQQLMRLFAQMTTGKVISSTTGRMIDLNGSDAQNGWAKAGMSRLDVLARFMEAKASPLASLVITMMRGKDFLGNPVSMPNEIVTRFTPMPIQDVAEAVQDGGWAKGLGLVAPAAVVGLGTQTYQANLPTAAGGEKKPQEGLAMNIGHWLWNRMNGIDDSPTELSRLTPKVAEQWARDATAAQVMGHHEATQVKGFFDNGFDQKSEIRKATARRMARVNKLYKDLMGANGEQARLAAEKNLLRLRADATGMDIEALQNPEVYSEVTE